MAHSKTLGRSIAKSTAPRQVIGTAIIDIGATGAPTIRKSRGMNGFAISRTSAGLYALTGIGLAASTIVFATIQTATGVDLYAKVIALSATAGTATLQCLTATTATDPASGAVINLLFLMESDS